MSGMGDALMGTGVAAGENRAVEAARAALGSPLLDDVSIRGAKGVLVNITGDERMSLHEVSQATAIISEEAGEEANVIFGAVVNDDVGEDIHVTVIATGFAHKEREIQPTFSAATVSGGALDIPDLPPEPATEEVEYAEVATVAGAASASRFNEPNLDIPTFLRKQLD